REPFFEGLRKALPLATPCRLSFILVDNTFVIRSTEGTSVRPVSHGSYTPLEQELGAPVPASDLYALGTTIHFAVTGEELPPYRKRDGDAIDLHPVTHGHPSRGFDEALVELLRCDPSLRGFSVHFDDLSRSRDDYGTMALSEDRLLICSNFGVN